jgi:type IV secretory pathway VirB10-like protein
MDWILEHLQIVGAIVVAAAYWLNQAREAKAAEKERQRRAAEGLPEEEEEEFEFEEEEIEAEVMGRRAVPPPLVQVKPPALPGPQVLTQNNSTELQRQEQLMDRLRQVRAERSASPASGAAATQRKVAAKGKGVASAVPIGLKARLRNCGEVRRAMVLKEILGKPVGLD